MPKKGNVRFDNDTHDRDTGNPLPRTETPSATDATGSSISVEQIVSTQREPSRPLRVLGIDDDGTVWCEPTEDDGDIKAYLGSQLAHGYVVPTDWDMEIIPAYKVGEFADSHGGDNATIDIAIDLQEYYYEQLCRAEDHVRIVGDTGNNTYYTDLVAMGYELFDSCEAFVRKAEARRSDCFTGDREVAALYLALNDLAACDGADWDAYANADNHSPWWLTRTDCGIERITWDAFYCEPDRIVLDIVDKDTGLYDMGKVSYLASGDNAGTIRYEMCHAPRAGERVLHIGWDASMRKPERTIIVERRGGSACARHDITDDSEIARMEVFEECKVLEGKDFGHLR